MTVRYWNKKVLLAKIESAYGTDPTLTGAANAILATNISLRPMDGEDVKRDLEKPYLGNSAAFPTGLRAVITFDTELAGSGVAGTAPAWGVLARGVGMAEVIVASTSVTYNPISASFESLYIKLNIDGVLHAIKGARGTAEITLNAQGIPIIRWTFTGLFVAPTDAAAATPTFTAFIDPLLATTTNTPTFTINSVALALKSLSFKLNNQVEPRFYIRHEEVLIVDRKETLDVTVEAPLLATFNPFSLAAARTQVAASIVHGTVAGSIATLTAATSQIMRPESIGNSQNIVEYSSLKLLPIPSSGNDQFTLALT